MAYEGDCLERVAHIASSLALAEDGGPEVRDGEDLSRKDHTFS
jgi:hypothetical protein